jgi:hypothetical protein
VARGISLEFNQASGVGRKYNISLAKQYARKEVREGKHVTIDRELRVVKACTKVSS